MKAGMTANDYRRTPWEKNHKPLPGQAIEQNEKGHLRVVHPEKKADSNEYPKHVRTYDGAIRLARNKAEEDAYLASFPKEKEEVPSGTEPVTETKEYPCGCRATTTGPAPLPDYCPEHPVTPAQIEPVTTVEAGPAWDTTQEEHPNAG